MRYLRNVFLLYFAVALERTPKWLMRSNEQIWCDAQITMALDLFACMLVPLGAGLLIWADLEANALSDSIARTAVGLAACGFALVSAALLVRASSGRFRDQPGLLDAWRDSGKRRAQLRTTRLILWAPLALCTIVLIAWRALCKLA